MILAVDIGNTHIVLGCMDGMEIKHMSRISTDRLRTENEYAVSIKNQLDFAGIDPENFSGAILSSVVPSLTNILSAAITLVAGIKPLIVGAGIKTGVNILLDDPSETGSDLVMSAAAALKLYTPPVIIIDMGTATTIIALDAGGAFIGGAIVPGVNLSLNALTSRASLLPKIPLEPPKRTIGSNTVECMKSGSVFGTASMLDGMIDRMEEELGSRATVVATGGIAGYIIPYCKHTVIRNDNLLLYGLAVTYEKNMRK